MVQLNPLAIIFFLMAAILSKTLNDDDEVDDAISSSSEILGNRRIRVVATTSNPCMKRTFQTTAIFLKLSTMRYQCCFCCEKWKMYNNSEFSIICDLSSHRNEYRDCNVKMRKRGKRCCGFFSLHLAPVPLPYSCSLFVKLHQMRKTYSEFTDCSVVYRNFMTMT